MAASHAADDQTVNSSSMRRGRPLTHRTPGTAYTRRGSTLLRSGSVASHRPRGRRTNLEALLALERLRCHAEIAALASVGQRFSRLDMYALVLMRSLLAGGRSSTLFTV